MFFNRPILFNRPIYWAAQTQPGQRRDILDLSNDCPNCFESQTEQGKLYIAQVPREQLLRLRLKD